MNKSMVQYVVLLTVSAMLVGYLLPPALSSISGAYTNQILTDTEKTVFLGSSGTTMSLLAPAINDTGTYSVSANRSGVTGTFTNLGSFSGNSTFTVLGGVTSHHTSVTVTYEYMTSVSWNAGLIAIFKILLPILIIVAVAVAFMPEEIKEKIG
jgi:hypothetical protein